ncbi:hypothetical protein FD754_001996 [Muntiacus muntjak]|uniref:Integrase zinc-binding domain-containing protein n=1 Tax=Muntiacus muntjak TaxID=9888 RepID=A0A5N3W809_MUNMU|nr:hypothetical protein FD754_001996 [Muntiacus muntjak]
MIVIFKIRVSLSNPSRVQCELPVYGSSMTYFKFYAFLPREAVTRFLMSCSECQKRMHLNPDGTDHKDNGKPPTLVTSMIDYNMPITMAYMKHMKLQLLNSQQDEQNPHMLSPSGRSGNPLQDSCLDNPMGRRAWQPTAHWVSKNQTCLSD